MRQTFHLSDAEKKIIERAECHARKDRAVRQTIQCIPRQRRMQILFHLWANGYGRGNVNIEPYDRFMERTEHYPAIRTLLSDDVIQRHVKGRVLDLSCGTGAVLEMLLEHCPGVKFVHANDTNIRMLEMARARIGPIMGKKAVFTSLDAEEWVPSAAWPRQKYDVVLLSQTWHLLKLKNLFEGHVAETVLKPKVGKVLWIDEFPARFSGEKGVIDLFFDSLLVPQSYDDFHFMLNGNRIPYIKRWTNIDGRHSMYAFLLQPPGSQFEAMATNVLVEMAVAAHETLRDYEAGKIVASGGDPLEVKKMRGNDAATRLLRMLAEHLKTSEGILGMQIYTKAHHALKIIQSLSARFTDQDLAEERDTYRELKRARPDKAAT